MGHPSEFLTRRKGSITEEEEEEEEEEGQRSPPRWTSSTPSVSNFSMSKAERILGTTGLPIRPSPSYNSSERVSPNTKPSNITLTVSKTSADYSNHAMSASTALVQHYRTLPRYQSPQHRESSTLLRLSHKPHPMLQVTPSKNPWRSLTGHRAATTAGCKTSELAEIDLHTSSALSLSSSDDDDKVDASLPTVRDSIMISDLAANNILIGKARAFKPKPKRRPNEPIPVLPVITKISPTAAVPVCGWDLEDAVTAGPRSADPRSEAAQQALRELGPTSKDEVHPHIRPHTSAAHAPSRTLSAGSAGGTSAKRCSLRSRVTEASSFGHDHKLIVVTAEEGALLEMMRSKRVTMAKHSFKEGYRMAIVQEEKKEKHAKPPNLQTHANLVSSLGNLLESVCAQSTGPPVEPELQEAKDDEVIMAKSPFGEIVDAFPSPPSTSTRFSTSS